MLISWWTDLIILTQFLEGMEEGLQSDDYLSHDEFHGLGLELDVGIGSS
jgi:hypothetical protein